MKFLPCFKNAEHLGVVHDLLGGVGFVARVARRKNWNCWGLVFVFCLTNCHNLRTVGAIHLVVAHIFTRIETEMKVGAIQKNNENFEIFGL